uniref:Si:ch211-203k16.3 n=1 Tax=Neogobius melanostomus TaxID=47308 RepID=A0A8C6SL81_9GOBI
NDLTPQFTLTHSQLVLGLSRGRQSQKKSWLFAQRPPPQLFDEFTRASSSPRSVNALLHQKRAQDTKSIVSAESPHMRNCPIDCASIYYIGERRSGLYTVIPLMAGVPVQVYCDMDTDGGGWTVIQRRVDGAVTFDRTWGDYRDGFGDLRSEFWLGNDHIHDLSTQGEYTLRIDLEDWSNKHKHALYQSFSVEDEEHQYRLHVSGFSGSAQDSFSWYHDKQSFSTPDSGNICAEISHGGWWYNQCFYAHLNGAYYRVNGIVWHSWKDSDYYSLRKVSMMIRPQHLMGPNV